jgi:hypothetical protein
MAFDQKGLNDYIDVAQRIADFREQYPAGSLQPAKPWEQAIVTGTKKDGEVTTQTFIVYTAAAYRTPDDPRPGIGVAWEVFPGRTPYTLGSELMNAETSAWGRAIIAVGASDSKRGIASREEVRNRVAEREDGLPQNRDGSLSRSQTTDEQKAAAGVMTSGQVKEHSALGPKRKESKPSERLGATPADDPWYDQSPGAFMETERDHDSPGTITRDQQKAMHASFGQLGIKDRAKRLELTAQMLGTPAPSSSSDLSYNHAGWLLSALAEYARTGGVAGLEAEAARRASA